MGKCHLNARNKRSKQDDTRDNNKPVSKQRKTAANGFVGTTNVENLSLVEEVDGTPQEEEDTASILNDAAGKSPHHLALHDNDLFQSLTLDSLEFINTHKTKDDPQCHDAYEANFELSGEDICFDIDNFNTHSSKSFTNDNSVKNNSSNNHLDKLSLSVHPIKTMFACVIQINLVVNL